MTGRLAADAMLTMIGVLFIAIGCVRVMASATPSLDPGLERSGFFFGLLGLAFLLLGASVELW